MKKTLRGGQSCTITLLSLIVIIIIIIIIICIIKVIIIIMIIITIHKASVVSQICVKGNSQRGDVRQNVILSKISLNVREIRVQSVNRQYILNLLFKRCVCMCVCVYVCVYVCM